MGEPIIYTNSVRISTSLHDLTLCLRLAGTDNPGGETVGTVIMSPQHAKMLLALLAKNIRVYEDTFGRIPTDVERAAPASGSEEPRP